MVTLSEIDSFGRTLRNEEREQFQTLRDSLNGLATKGVLNEDPFAPHTGVLAGFRTSYSRWSVGNGDSHESR